MPLLTTTLHPTPIHTPFSPSVPRSRILSFLHNHEALIKLNANVTSCTPLSTTPSSPFPVSSWLQNQAAATQSPTPGSSPPKYWSVTDGNPMWSKLPDLRFSAAMVDVSDGEECGVDVVVEAGGGTRVWQKWRVVRPEGYAGGRDGDGDGDEGPWVLVEEPRVMTWSFLAGFVRGTLEKAHAENHRRLRERLEKGGM